MGDGQSGAADLYGGPGHLRDICSASAYCLLPHILATLVNIGISYLLTSEEAMLLTWISMIGLLWSGHHAAGRHERRP